MLRRAGGMAPTGGVAPERTSAGAAGAAHSQLHPSPEVAGHVRTGRLRSIRLRLLLPIIVATAGLIVLGVVQTQFAVRTSLDARRAQVMASTATATVRLTHRLEQEVAETDALRARGGTSGLSLVTAAQAQTDLAASGFRSAAAAARDEAPALHPVLDAAEAEVAKLSGIRDAVGTLKAGQLSGDRYADVTGSLIAVADALPTQLSDPQLAATARAVGAISAAEHLGAQQRDLLSQVFRHNAFGPGDLAQLAQLTGAQDERLAEFTRSANPAQLARYAQLANSDDVVNAQRMRAGALAAHPDPNALKADPDVWYIAQSNALRKFTQMQLDLSNTLDATSRDRQVRAQTSSVLTGTATGLLVLLAFSAALLFGVRTSRRLRGLRGAALAVAYTELPGAISAMSEADEPVAVRAALLQAAAAETEDYDRVDASAVFEVGIAAHAVRDLIHLLAELLENATTFSPPGSKVRVAARRAVEGVHLTVFDEGIGMPHAQVAELNNRLRRPTMLTAELAGTMGLLVVSRLAARHGIEVELRSALGGGTAALVALPTALLAHVPPRPQPQVTASSPLVVPAQVGQPL